MKEFTVCALVTISIITKVDAKTKDEALRIAGDRYEIETYEWGQEYREKEAWLASEYDGDPFDLEIYD